MITVNLSEAEVLALLRLVGPFVSRFPKDETMARAESKLDSALLAHEENNVAR